jgi:hypothetical protein
MRKRHLTSIFICLVYVVLVGQAYALPDQADICTDPPKLGLDSPVAKRLLANNLLFGNKEALKRIIGYPDRWRTIFLDNLDFCQGDKDNKGCEAARQAASIAAISFFQSINNEPGFPPQGLYGMSSALRSKPSDNARKNTYFSTDLDDGLFCLAPKGTPNVVASSPGTGSRVRLRGVSDDLYIDRTQQEFKATSQAMLSVSGDHSTVQTQTAKVKGAIGYALDVGGYTSVIPYLSFYQSITDIVGKSSSTDATSNVAAGLLFSTTIGESAPQVISAKPEFYQNTRYNSQLETLRLSWTPYTYFDLSNGGINLNAPRPIPYLPFNLFAEVQLDFRLDSAHYSNTGNDPVQRLLNDDYTRAGSRVGFALTLDDPNYPSLTFVIAETFLHGFTGSARNLDMFETSLTYNLDPKTSYLGLTANYRKGLDEVTALRVQTWTIGLSARY